MVFYWSLGDNKSPQVFRIFISILAVLSNAVVLMISTRSLISKSSYPWINPLVTVLSAPITISITVTFMFYSFFNSLARSWNLSHFFLSFSFTLLSTGTAGPLFCWLWLSLVEIRWSACISKSHRILCVTFSRTDSELCIYHLFVWSNLSLLHNSQWITFFNQSCLVLYSLCANLPHSFILWLIVSSLSPHNLHLLFCCILSIFALTLLVLMALFCAVISGNSVSLSKGFSFLVILKFSRVRFRLFVVCCEPYSCFSSYCFSGSFCSVDVCVVCIVSGRCNQSSSTFLI